MALIDHIRNANNADFGQFTPCRFQGEILGWVHYDRLPALEGFPDVFQFSGEEITLFPEIDEKDARSRRLADVTQHWNENGLVPGWRGELYPVSRRFNQNPIATIERAACPVLGLRSWGVHMTGYVRRGDGLHIWVATRAHDKPNYPGMLDNTVAGGQPVGLSPLENMIKESEEEAGIPPFLTEKIQPVGMLAYNHQIEMDLKPDQMFCFDLELPEDFVPKNTDGEVDSFELMPASDVLDIIRNTRDFKYNCNLCLMDFFIRHGIITPDSEPDYVDLCVGLLASNP